jgi:hypothetical protein
MRWKQRDPAVLRPLGSPDSSYLERRANFMSKSKTFRATPIPHRAKNGDPMQYLVLSEDGKNHTDVTRAVCLAPAEESDNPYPQRWYVDEESGFVLRLPRNQMGENLARENMRFIWREAKRDERWRGRIVAPTVDDDGDEVVFELVDTSADIATIMEDKALLDTLYTALAALAQEDHDLIKDIFWHKKTERELAPLLGLKEPKSVNKRKHRILEILRNNEALKSFFE